MCMTDVLKNIMDTPSFRDAVYDVEMKSVPGEGLLYTDMEELSNTLHTQFGLTAEVHACNALVLYPKYSTSQAPPCILVSFRRGTASSPSAKVIHRDHFSTVQLFAAGADDGDLARSLPRHDCWCETKGRVLLY